MNRWLVKTEPGEYSFQDLISEGTTVWDGVRAPAALKNIQLMESGDPVFIYHTGKEKAIVGTGRITREAYPDPDEHDHRLLVVDIAAEKALDRPVSLRTIKDSNRFADWDLVRLPRLSVLPVSKLQWDAVIHWSSHK